MCVRWLVSDEFLLIISCISEKVDVIELVGAYIGDRVVRGTHLMKL